MGQRGPAPKSKKELEQSGSWRAKDRPDDLTLPSKTPDAPDDLNAAAKREWDRIAKLLGPSGVLTEGDRIGLTVLCELWAEYRELGTAQDKCETGSDDWRTVFNARQNVRKQLKDWCSRFGLTPADRPRVKVEGKPKDKHGSGGFEKFVPKLTG